MKAQGGSAADGKPMTLHGVCGAKTRSGGHCGQAAGWGTGHPGEGRCKLHGGKSPVRSGRYSTVSRPRIRDLIEQFQGDDSPLDILPELAAARALFQDFIERYDEFTDALVAWHDSWGEERARKPVQVLDISDAYRILSEVTKIAKRIEDVRAQNAISRQDFYRVMTEMGRVVDLVVEDPKQRERIHEGWMGIALA